MKNALERSWYRPRGWSLLLAPFSLLYGVAVAVRRTAYRLGWLDSVRVPVPVIVIGNITVGGSGKTPLTAHVARHLRRRGLTVGIVARGYGGRAPHYPMRVEPYGPAGAAGDEPVLLAARGDAAVVVDPDRARAAKLLVEEYHVDIIVADDGLQHYGLARDAEIAVVDARRRYGNGWLLPAGPLREPLKRASEVDLQLEHGSNGDFSLVAEALRPVNDDIGAGKAATCELTSFAGQQVHAVAGIGAPESFFAMLRNHGVDVIEHAFADHHAFTAADILFPDDRAVLMTEKDAVKCRSWADPRHWYVPVTVRFNPASEQRLDALLEPCVQGIPGKDMEKGTA